MHNELCDSSLNSKFLQTPISYKNGLSDALDANNETQTPNSLRDEENSPRRQKILKRRRTERLHDQITSRLRHRHLELRRNPSLWKSIDLGSIGRRNAGLSRNYDDIDTSVSNRQDNLTDRVNDSMRRQRTEKRCKEEKTTSETIATQKNFNKQMKGSALLARFRLVSKLIVICKNLIEDQKLGKTRNSDYLFPYLRTIYYQEYDDVSNITLDDAQNNHRVMIFNPRLYRASKESQITKEARRILSKPLHERTASELAYAKAALMSVRTYSEYPVRMQEQIVQVGSYERFESKRMILRQGHRPSSFYFILSGSVVVMVLGRDSPQSIPICYRKRGDTFGEQVINVNSRRMASVVSKETVELLSIDIEYIRTIFMTGDLKNLLDSDHLEFLRSLDLLRGWPIGKIIDASDPKMAVSMYFRRGEVLASDSRNLDALIIVKSGSIRVLKKVAYTNGSRVSRIADSPTMRNGERQPRLQKASKWFCPAPDLNPDDEDRLATASNHVAYFLLSEISLHIPQIQQHDEDDPLKLPVIENTRSGADRKSVLVDVQRINGRDIRIRNATSLVTGQDRRTRHKMPDIKRRDLVQNDKTGQEKQLKEERRPEQDNLMTSDDPRFDLEDFYDHSDDFDHEFIQVQTLTAGEVFGLANLIHDDQPSMCVVSNGAECILLNNGFYLCNAPERLIATLKLNCPQYPTENEIQEKFQKSVDWRKIKGKIFSKTINDLLSERGQRSPRHFTADL